MASLVCRAVTNSVLAGLGIVAFLLVWTASDWSDVARRLAAFAAAMFFVVVYQEAARSWRVVLELNAEEKHHA